MELFETLRFCWLQLNKYRENLGFSKLNFLLFQTYPLLIILISTEWPFTLITVGPMTIGLMTVGQMTFGLMTVGPLRWPHYFNKFRVYNRWLFKTLMKFEIWKCAWCCNMLDELFFLNVSCPFLAGDVPLEDIGSFIQFLTDQ